MAKRVSYKLYGPEIQLVDMVTRGLHVNLEDLAKKALLAACERIVEQARAEAAKGAPADGSTKEGNSNGEPHNSAPTVAEGDSQASAGSEDPISPVLADQEVHADPG